MIEALNWIVLAVVTFAIIGQALLLVQDRDDKYQMNWLAFAFTLAVFITTADHLGLRGLIGS